MFFVVNKSKIYSYIIALCTVVILFVAATNLNNMATPSENILETSTNTTSLNIVQNSMIDE